MKKWIIILLLLVVIIGVCVGAYFILNKNANLTSNATNQKPNTGNYSPVTVTKQNLPQFLEAQNVVKDLPSDALILIKLYNYDSGERAWEESYVIKKGKVELGSVDNPDLTIILNSKYVSSLSDFCGTIQKARANNDLGMQYGLSEGSLLWKYKGMMGYKSCIGL